MSENKCCYKTKGRYSKKRTQKIKPRTLVILIILLTWLCLLSSTYSKYVLNGEITIGVKTAEYYFRVERDELAPEIYVTINRNK